MLHVQVNFRVQGTKTASFPSQLYQFHSKKEISQKNRFAFETILKTTTGSHQVQVLVRASRVDEHQEMPERLFGDIGNQDLLRLSLTHGRAQRRLAADQWGLPQGNGRFGNTKPKKIFKTQVIHLTKFRFCW